MKLSELLKYEEDLQLEKSTVVILRWIALIGQLITIYIVHFLLKFELPIIFCSLTIFCGGLTNIFIQFNFKKNILNNTESTILLFYDVLQLSVLIYLTGGVTNPFVMFIIVPAVVSSTLLNIASTLFLTIISIFALLILTFNYFPLPSSGNLHFHVPNYYIYAIPFALITILIFLNYFGFRFGYEARRRGKALGRLELILAKEQELESIGHQAAAAAHSLGTPLSTITVIAKELKKEVNLNKEFSEDINLTRRCFKLSLFRSCNRVLLFLFIVGKTYHCSASIVNNQCLKSILFHSAKESILVSYSKILTLLI